MDRHDFDTPTWDRLRAFASKRLAQHRSDLERPQTDDHTSRILRGRIQELKELLALQDAATAEGAEGHE